MALRKSPREFFGKGRERGSEQCNDRINDSAVFKHVTPKVLKEYGRMIGLWNQYAEDHARDDPSPYKVKSLKDFIKEIAFGIDGAEGDPNPGQGTVMLYWKQFMAGWRREHEAIPANITPSVTNFIKSELPEILQESKIRLVKSKRLRRFGTKNHFVHLGHQLWGNDWVEYERPATRVYDWADFMAIVCSSARIGEYIESTCRAGSGRGMYYKDVTFGVFRNEHGNAEFAIQLVRDAKGMTDNPDKRPEHALYEGLGPMPLICNAMLPMLAILIAAKAFRDYDTLKDFLDIKPPEGEMVHLRWKDSILDQPFFKSMSARKTAGKMESAKALSKRLRALGFRAGYPHPPTIHDFRAEGLYWIDKLYSEAQRMKHAGHIDPATYNKHYQPNNSGTDGQASYFGQEVRSIVNDLFRGLTVPRNPLLPQSLPAEKQEALKASPEFIAIEKKAATLSGRQDQKSTSLRKKLYEEKRRLADRELRQWQKTQPHGTGTSGTATSPPCYHRGIFNRVKFLMPERDRLASSLFETDTLRSPTGLQALGDMIALCEADAEVKFRPGLEPEKCRCADPMFRRNLPQSAPAAGARQPTYDWKHIYSCVKKTRSGFVELCFLCNKWVFGKLEWSDHCRSHLACPDELPVQCDPLLYGGVLATAGYCLFCIADKSLEPELRLRQFLDRGPWKDHVFDHYERYVQAVDDKKPVTCPYPSIRCGGAFDSVKHLKFHLLDAHCRDFVKESTSLELEENDDVKPAPAKRQRKRSAELDREAKVDTYHFVDETVQTACRHRAAAASLPSPFEGHVSPPDSCQIQGWSEDGDAGSGDVLLRSPSSLDNDGVEECSALIVSKFCGNFKKI
ncbi:hypothetical protein, variant [Gaeumannomyces tritici R3-111a-1]|uniref:Uncharacterized protein n=1 Tax=Gaeumannomyces tritici (strain R3-111a-1) TaxID=644352 RepID=J3PJ80_GAET3|nr:hypothetical protein, variant [Gaeumannomyces tritici R3-111a-1]EJT68897.1 hypothetical protein, variant [Gaeumannomyces tritici R3-111a-1]